MLNFLVKYFNNTSAIASGSVAISKTGPKRFPRRLCLLVMTQV